MKFVLVNDQGGQRNLHYVVLAGVYRVFYTLYAAGNYRIKFMVNRNEEMALSIRGLRMSQTFLIIKNLSQNYLTYDCLHFNYHVLKTQKQN